jgi:hypothetical protein
MAAGTRNIRIYLSPESFALLADAMCAFSKSSGRFQSLRAAVQHACSRIKSHGISKNDLDLFLSEFSLDGDIEVWLEIKPDWAEDYDQLRQKLAEISGKPVHDKVVISFLVYLARMNHLY